MIIAPARAYSIINNPYVRDDMKVVCAVFANDTVAAYTAAFPEILEKPKGKLAWWFSTLWCNPSFQGRGFGLVVMGTLVEEYGLDNCFDAEGAPETVSILNKLGLITEYRQRYVFMEKKINKGSFRGQIAWIYEQFRGLIGNSFIRKCWDTLNRNNFSISCQKYIDDESYGFIQDHSDTDLILRRQETFDWILQFPFLQTVPLCERSLPDNHFSSITESYQSLSCKIFISGLLVGVAVLVLGHDSLSVKYLYYEKDFSDVVYSALLMQCIKCKIARFETGDRRLADFTKEFGIFPKFLILDYSLSTPKDFIIHNESFLQPGEGDMFV